MRLKEDLNSEWAQYLPPSMSNLVYRYGENFIVGEGGVSATKVLVRQMGKFALIIQLNTFHG